MVVGINVTASTYEGDRVLITFSTLGLSPQTPWLAPLKSSSWRPLLLQGLMYSVYTSLTGGGNGGDADRPPATRLVIIRTSHLSFSCLPFSRPDLSTECVLFGRILNDLSGVSPAINYCRPNHWRLLYSGRRVHNE